MRYWAAEGVTSFKVYRQITKEGLEAIIDEAHGLGLPVTAYLESVTCREAAALGIDNIEHGCSADGCEADPNGAPGQALIRLLVDKRVAVTFTPVDLLRPLSDHELDLLDPGVRERYLRQELRRFAPGSAFSSRVQARRELAGRFLLAFAKAGGRVILGSDAGCCGLANFAGRSGHVAVEMLVRLGFPPLEAMRIATLNGATFLGIDDRTGSIAAGKEADLLVVRGDPSAQIEDIEHVEAVWSNGVQYDPQTLLAQVKGEVGWR